MASHSRSLGKGFLAGALGGAVGTVVLNAFQAGSLKATDAAEDALRGDHRYAREQQELLDTYTQAHAKAAEVVTGRHLDPSQREQAVPATEFTFGILFGGIYGALAEYVPAVTAGMGGVYGAVLFTGASEMVLPALGWVPSPADRTPVQHGGGLAGNVVYGICTELVRRLLR